MFLSNQMHMFLNKLGSFILEQAIKEAILSFNFPNYKSDILTVDAEYSYKDGVIVLVTGCLTGNDNVERKFSESFFLVPQEKGYFVMNAILRYMGESESMGADSVANNHIEESASISPLTPEPGMFHVSVCELFSPFFLVLIFSSKKRRGGDGSYH
jgi:hypothetical protein